MDDIENRQGDYKSGISFLHDRAHGVRVARPSDGLLAVIVDEPDEEARLDVQ